MEEIVCQDEFQSLLNGNGDEVFYPAYGLLMLYTVPQRRYHLSYYMRYRNYTENLKSLRFFN